MNIKDERTIQRAVLADPGTLNRLRFPGDPRLPGTIPLWSGSSCLHVFSLEFWRSVSVFLSGFICFRVFGLAAFVCFILRRCNFFLSFVWIRSYVLGRYCLLLYVFFLFGFIGLYRFCLASFGLYFLFFILFCGGICLVCLSSFYLFSCLVLFGLKCLIYLPLFLLFVVSLFPFTDCFGSISSDY